MQSKPGGRLEYEAIRENSRAYRFAMKTENTLDTHIPTKSSRDVSSYPYAVSGTEAELGTTLEGLFEPSRPRRSSRLAWWLSEFIV
ncbi:MAG: hypothetical protein ACE5GA_10790, partial [Candidatus Zixiibacteriota bacterium]